MGDNVKLQALRNDIANLLNSYDLPIVAKKNILELILIEVTNTSNEIIQIELEKISKEQEESK